MRDLINNKTIPDDEVVFYDGFLYIISRTNEYCERYTVVGEYKVDVLILDPQFDNPISLSDIKRELPSVTKVIHEDYLKGEIYNYGNHKGETWEMTGTTMGFA